MPQPEDDLPKPPTETVPAPEDRPARRPRRHVAFAVLSVALSLLAALAILEAGFRVILYRYAESMDRLYEEGARIPGQMLSLREILRPSDNDRRVYELYPGLEGTFLELPLRLNSHGFRDRERTVSKPPGVRRIAVVGDSVVFGWGVRAEERFTDRLEGLLNGSAPAGTSEPAGGGRWEVLNFGIPGYNTVMELALLKDEVLKFAPDAVVLNVVANDAELPNFVREKPKLWALGRSFVLEAVQDRMQGLELGYTARKVGGGLTSTPGYRPELVPARFQPLIGWDNAKRALFEFAAELKQREIPAFAIAHHPFLNPLLDAPGQPLPPEADLNAPWLAAAREAGFAVVDPLPLLIDYLKERRLRHEALWVKPGEDFHPNAAAHELLAKALENPLRHKLVPQRASSRD